MDADARRAEEDYMYAHPGEWFSRTQVIKMLKQHATAAVAEAVKDEQYLRRIKEACLESAEKEVEQQAKEIARRIKFLKTYTACPQCGQALELSPGARDEIVNAVAQAVKGEQAKSSAQDD